VEPENAPTTVGLGKNDGTSSDSSGVVLPISRGFVRSNVQTVAISSATVIPQVDGNAALAMHPVESLPFQPPAAREESELASKVALAKSQGFIGEACGACGSFQMILAGKCTSCTACGQSSGCG
jgi:ribonucleoside-diphosphate reductase alpha chain